MSVFGTITTPGEVAEAMISHLQAWETSYLAEMERISGRDPQELPRIRAWETVPREPDKWSEDQLPAVLCVSTGLLGAPRKEGDGTMSGKFSVGIGVITSANTQENSLELASLYFTGFLAAIMQHPSLGGFARGTDCTDIDQDLIPVDKRRTLASFYGTFAVDVEQVLNLRAGLAEPPDEPYEPIDPVTVEETEITVTHQEE